MLENSPYTESDVQTALQMTSNGVSVTQIAEHLDVSRQTIYNWKREGLLTGGTHWDEWLEDHNAFEIMRQENEAMAVKVESSDEFWQEQLPQLRQAVQSTVDKLANGEIPLDASDLTEVVGLIRKIENRGKELAMMQEKFMRAVFFALREELDDKHKFMAIKERIKQIRLDQLEDFDEEFAKTMLDDVE
jgi:predicted DNA-binding protein YlxM (UPF0122 family)